LVTFFFRPENGHSNVGQSGNQMVIVVPASRKSNVFKKKKISKTIWLFKQLKYFLP
jgi:hypothetical protein